MRLWLFILPGNVLPYAVIITRDVVDVVVPVVGGSRRRLRVQTKYIVCIEVENGAKVRESIKRRH